ncbi:MAG: DUF11 domain-containing protein, partial [Acidimicrobiales bacterium]
EVTTPVTEGETTSVAQSSSLSINKPAPANADNDSSSSVTLNDVLTYTITATNTGTTTQSNVVVSDPLIQPTTITCATLAPGATCVLSGTYTVDQDDVDTGSIVNTASVQSDEVTTPVTEGETTSVAQSSGLSMVKTALTTSYAAVGDEIDYQYVVTNTGTVTVTDPIFVTDDKIVIPMAVNCPALPTGGLAPGADLTCTATYTVIQDDLDTGSVTNIASATDGTSTSPTVTETVNAIQSPAMTLVKTPVETSYAAVGDTISYTYTVTNTGNVLIADLAVTDDLIDTVTCNVSAIGNGDANLDPMEEVVCTGLYTVTQADLDTGSVTNNASATGTPSGGTLTPPTTDATVNADQTPALSMSKTANETTFAAVGDVLTYDYVVENTGNVFVSALAVTDDKIDTVTCDVAAIGNNDANLDPGEIVTCTANYTVTQADIDAGEVTNIASATGAPAGGTLTDAPATETVNADQAPGMSVVKTATDIQFTLPGDITMYQYVVTNTGNTTITDPISVSDNLVTVSCPALPAGGLAPLATLTCTSSYTVTQMDLDIGSVTNLASATDGTTTSPQTSETIPATQDPALSIVKTPLDTSFANAGEIISYEYSLTNDGNLTLTGGVNVIDDKIGTISCITGNFIPGDTQTCTADYTVTQTDIDAGFVTNQAYAQNGMLTSPPADATVNATQTPALSFDKRATTTTFTNAGDVLSYEFDVQNTGNVTLTGVGVADSLTSVSCPQSTLLPTESMVCTASYTVTQADVDAGFVTNNASGSGTPPSGPVVNVPDSVTVNSDPMPSISFTKRALDTDFGMVGDILNYEFDVENTGSVTLSNIAVTDSLTSVSCPLTTLAPMGTMVCTASYSVTQADVDAGSVTNNASVASELPGGSPLTPVPSSATVNATITPSLSVDKVGLDVDFSAVGDILDYSYTVTNTGNVTVTGIALSDDLIGAISCPATSLTPSANFVCTASYTVTQADIDAGSVTNIATVDGTPAGGMLAPATDTVTVDGTQAPALTTLKTATTTSYDSVGDTISYQYVVSNAGNVTITDPVSVSDDKIASVSCPALPRGGLLPTDSITCTAVYVVTQADIDTGSVVNTASSTDGATTSPEVSETVNADQSPSIAMTKTASPQVYSSVGETVNYSYVVTNTGNTTITTDIMVSDNKIAIPFAVVCPTLPAGGLAPRASLTCTASSTITQEDLDSGSLTNTAVATDGTISSPSIMETATANQMPALTMAKNALTANFSAVGDRVDYEYVVTNSGNITITDAITVSDDKIASVNCPIIAGGELAPNATTVCTSSYFVTQADIDTGNVVNNASASAGSISSASVSETVDAVQMPALSVSKSALVTSYDAPGDVLMYEYLVRNEGNTTLTGNIMVSDDKIAIVSCPSLPMAGLAPNDTVTCSANYVVMQTDIDAGSITNIASATNGALSSPTDTVTVNADQSPMLTTIKTAQSSTYQTPGETIDYEYEVINSGNITITNAITVSDSRIASVNCSTLPVGGLIPGDSIACTATDSVDQADIDAGVIENIATATDGTTTSAPVTERVLATRIDAIEVEKTATVINFANPGDVTSYEYVVTNTGNVTITNPITVNDNLIATVNCPALPAGGLLPNDTLTCTADYTVTTDNIAVGSVTNVASATDGNSTSGLTSETIPANTNPAISMTKTSMDTVFNAVGQVLTYNYQVENTGDIALVGDVSIIDNKIGTFVCYSGILLVNQIVNCQETYTVTQTDIDTGFVTNDAYADHPRTSSPPDFVTIPADQMPELTLAKTALTADYNAVGDVLSYEYEVTNSGNTTITFPVSIDDDRISSVNCPALPAGGLLPNVSITCTATDIVTQADIDAGSVVNNATATDGFTTTAPQFATVNAIQTPSLGIEKVANNSDFTTVGEILDYTYVVTNTGNVTVANSVTVTDDRIMSVTCGALPVGGLLPGGSLSCTGSDTVTQEDLDLGTVTNIASASDGSTTSPTDTVTITGTQAPSMAITKTANETTFATVGETLTYTYSVENTGNITISNAISVSDDKIAIVNCPALPAGGLAPGAALDCSASYTVSQEDIDAGFVTNIASATDGTVTTPETSATVNSTQTPAMTVVKSADLTSFETAGDIISYDYVVTNTGNVTIINEISITDDRIADVNCPILPAGGLLPATTLFCTATDIVTQADLDAGFVTNTASATDGTVTSAPVSVTVTGNQTNDFTITKVARNNDFAAVGDLLNYEYVVTNTGNVSIVDPITVTDDKIATVTCPALPADGLVPNATLTCTAPYLVIQEDIDAGEVTNIASALSGGKSSIPAIATVTGTQSPDLSIVLTPDTTTVSAVGELVTYTYVVTNTGNTTITDAISVSDDLGITVMCPALPAGGLAPGATLTCTAVYSVTQEDLDAGSIDNSASATDGTTTSEPGPGNVGVDQTNDLTIAKTATSVNFALPGDIVSYEYVVTNSGNVTVLTDISVSDDKIATVNCPALSAGGLAPSASLICAADYEVTQTDIDAGEVTNIATATDGTATSAPDTATVAADSMPEMTLTKTIVDSIQVGGPIYDVIYQITATNSGNVSLTDVQIQDDLATILEPSVIYETPTAAISGFTGGAVNVYFDGSNNLDLLTGSPSLPVGDMGVITLSVRIDTTNGGPALGNTAIGSSPELPDDIPSNDPSMTPDDDADTNPTLFSIADMDGDGAPDNLESLTGDRDGDGIPDAEDYDPTGYFYCEENGTILTGGGIVVTGPAGSNGTVGTANNIVIVQDGSDGYFQFYVTAPGRYTLTPTYPTSGVASTARPVQNIALDVTSLLPSNPAILGSSEAGNTGVLADFSAAANTPYYFEFDIEAGDPSVMMNNIPLKNCGIPEISLNKTLLSEPSFTDDGRQLVSYALTAENTGETLVEDVQITDDLGAVYGAERVEVDRIEIGTEPVNFASDANTGFNGVTSLDMLTGTGDLLPGESVTVELDVLVNPENEGDFTNNASVSALAPLDGAAIGGDASATVSLAPASDASLLRVVKTAQPRTVQIGDPVLYTVSVTNESASTMTDLRITDRIPHGFSYVPNTAILSNATDTLVLEPDVLGRGVLTWTLDSSLVEPFNTLQAGASMSVSLRLLAGPNVEFGAHENQAYVESLRTGTRSETATAVVDYIPEPTFDCTPVIGRVYDDVNHNGYPDDGEPGLPSVRLATVNGDIITTDQYGRYHIPCAVIADSEKGSNFLLKADVRTLPLGYKTTTENPRVVRATRGKFIKMNFGAAHRPKLRIDLYAADYANGTLTNDAQGRIRSLLGDSPSIERAILVYHAADDEDINGSQAALSSALSFVKSNKPKDLNDIALEASWGDAEAYDYKDEDVARGQYYDRPANDNADYAIDKNYRTRVLFEGDDLRPTTSIERNRQGYGKSAGLRGYNHGEQTGDTRPENTVGGRRDQGTAENARPGRLQRWTGWGDKTTAYADGMEIETTVTALDIRKNLNAQVDVVAQEQGRALMAEGYWNYNAFVEKAELRLFDAKKSTRGTPVAIMDMTNGEGRMAVTTTLPTHMNYVLRVYNDQGRFDETYPKPITLGDVENDTTLEDWAAQSNTAFGGDTLLIDNITVKGGAVRVYGRNVPGTSVAVMDRTVPVDENGKFVVEELMPSGEQAVEILVAGENDTVNRIVRMVDVKTRDHFFVGQVEMTIGERVEPDANDDKTYEEGRIAFYLRSRLSELWSLTATADTGEAAIENIFDGLDDKDVSQLLRRLDPDRYYPTYGDDSTIEQDAPTSGRFYARVERLDDYALWGNYRTEFNDTEFGRVQRTLYGAKLRWDENGNPTRYGDDRTTLTAFIAEGGSRQGRDELRGTGGSVYYLRHGDISIGSEILRVETRDSVSGITLETRRLTYGSDYELDFIQGRVLLNQPLGSTGDDGRLFRDGSQSGNETVLVVDYEYSPILGSDDDAVVFGARGTRWFGDVLKLGATFNHDTDGGAESDLLEFDATIQFAAGTYLKGEIAKSKGLGVETYRSIDGGFSYSAQPRGGLVNDDSAMAYAVEAAADFSEIESFNLDGNAYAYWRLREAGFAGYAQAANADITQYGGGMNVKLMENLSLNARADVSDDQTLGTNSYAELSADYKLDDHVTITGGVAFSDDARGNAGTSVGARAEYAFNDDDKVYIFGQVGIEGENTRTTDRIGAGAEMRLSKKVTAGGEASTGEDGLGVRASIRYHLEDGDEYYLAYDLPLNSSAGNNRGTMNLGARRRYSDALSVYGEERFQFNEVGLNGLTHAYGVDYKPGNWNLNASAEVGRVQELERVALSAGAGFTGERMKAGVQGEYREDESTNTGDVRKTWLLRTTAQYQANEELRLQGKFNLAFSDQTGTPNVALGPVDFNKAEFTEGSVAAAYRPIWDDRFNVLAKYVYLNDLSPSAQRFNGETLNYRQRSNIISVDGSYDIAARWTLGAKYGHREGEVTSSRETLDFTSSKADLGVIRLDYHATHKWDATLEGRYLNIGSGVITRTGGLAGAYRHMNDNVKLGGGIVWGGIEEEYLAAKESGDIGWFLNVVGKF